MIIKATHCYIGTVYIKDVDANFWTVDIDEAFDFDHLGMAAHAIKMLHHTIDTLAEFDLESITICNREDTLPEEED